MDLEMIQMRMETYQRQAAAIPYPSPQKAYLTAEIARLQEILTRHAGQSDPDGGTLGSTSTKGPQ